MKNRKSLKNLLAPILCAALITAGMGLPVPAQSLEAEETADQTVEAEESAGQAAEEEGTEDQAVFMVSGTRIPAPCLHSQM